MALAIQSRPPNRISQSLVLEMLDVRLANPLQAHGFDTFSQAQAECGHRDRTASAPPECAHRHICEPVRIA
jgi:hypothetical protein